MVQDDTCSLMVWL